MSDVNPSGKPQRPARTIVKGSWFSRCSHSLVGQKSGIKALLWAVVINFILFAIALTYTTPMYETDDDQAMQSIASGFDTGRPDAHLIFTNILIGWVLKFLYGTWAGCNWYFIYLIAVHYAALTAIAFLVISRRGGWLFTLLYIGFFLIVEMRILLLPQFTTTAFLAGTAGLLLLVDGLRPAHPAIWSKVIIGLFFFSLMCLIRTQVALLFGAIAGPFLLERLGLKGWRRLLGTALACIGIFASLQGINHWAYRDPAWAEFSEYNYMRGEVQDISPDPIIPQVAADVGWTKNDAFLFSNFYYPDRDVHDRVSKMRHLLEKLKMLQRDGAPTSDQSPTRPSLTTRLLFLPNMYRTDYTGDVGASARLMNLAILTAIWCIFAAGPLRRRIATVLVINYLIFWMISFHLLTTARLPERVAYNFPLFIFAICLYWATGFQHATSTTPTPTSWFEYYKVRFWKPRTLRLATLVSLSAWIIFYLFNVSMLARTLAAANSHNENLKYISEKILIPIGTLLPAGKKPLVVTLPSDSPFEESFYFYPSAEKLPFFVVWDYGWTTQSPPFSQVIERYHLDPHSPSVVGRPDVFFLMRPSWIVPLEIFYQEHYGLKVRFDMALNTDNMPQFEEYRMYLYHARVDDGTT